MESGPGRSRQYPRRSQKLSVEALQRLSYEDYEEYINKIRDSVSSDDESDVSIHFLLF